MILEKIEILGGHKVLEMGLKNMIALEIKTFGLVSRILDVEVAGLKNHNFLPWGCSSNLIGPAKGFLRLLRNFY